MRWWGTQKIWGCQRRREPHLRAGTVHGHAEAVHVELHQPLDAEQVKAVAHPRASPCLMMKGLPDPGARCHRSG